MDPRWLALIGLIACGDGERSAPRKAPRGDTLVLVDGTPISLPEVLRMADAGALSPTEALHDLLSERLLVDYAHRRGYDLLPSVELGVKQVMVQRLLVDELADAGISEDKQAMLERLLTALRTSVGVRYDDAAIEHAFAPTPQ